MKTIFVTSFHPLISRNILGTPLLASLTSAPDVAIVLLVPDYKQAYFQHEFAGPKITVVGIQSELAGFDRISRQLSLLVQKTQSMKIRRRWEILPRRFTMSYGVKVAAAWLFGGRVWAMRIARWLDCTFGARGNFAEVFEKYNPALLFATDIIHDTDIECMRNAHDRGVPTIGMARSWDNLTGKGLLRFLPETIVVANEIMKGELIRYHAVPAERIRVTGIPHYDAYLNPPPFSRDAFMRQIGFDPKNKLILFAPIGNRHIKENVTDEAIMRMLVRAREEGKFPADASVLVRCPPTIDVSFGSFTPPPWIKIEQPGRQFGGGTIKDAELDPEDDRHLIESLRACDLLLTGPSTIAVDAAVFDKPIVLISFDNGGRGYWRSIRAWYDYDHYQAIVKSGGAKKVEDEAECIHWIREYLAHPETDQAGRRRIAEEQCYKLDGKSTERLLAVLEAALTNAAEAKQKQAFLR